MSAPARVRRVAAGRGDVFVLAGHPLRDGVRLEQTARFTEDVWALAPAIHQPHQYARFLDFTAVPERFRLTVKEAFHALLAGDRPPGCERIRSIYTIHVYFGYLLDFLGWAEGRTDRLTGLGSADLADFHRYLEGQRIHVTTRRAKRRAVRLLWLLRERLSQDRLSVDPDTPAAPNARGENRAVDNVTERIPEPVMAPVLVWALRWITDFADDVLAARDEWQQLHHNNRRHLVARGEQGLLADVLPRLSQLLAQYQDERRPLPGRHGQVNYSHIAREVGCEPLLLHGKHCKPLIQGSVRLVGISDRAYLRARPGAEVDGRPWLPAIAYTDVPLLTRLLQTASYLTIAYLSGMRDCEAKNLRRGCLVRQQDETGRVARRKLRGQAFKGEDDPTGVDATWIVTAPVQRAIEVLEQLQPADQDELFALLPTSKFYARARTTRAKTTDQTNLDLRAFVGWINSYAHAHGRPDHVPTVNGQPWRLTTRQFRRTLAWFIARQPGGVIAGAMQYRHLRVQMFEGYAGTSASGFRAEVEAEEAITRGEKLAHIAIHPGHHRLSGPAGVEAETRLADFIGPEHFTGKAVADRQRLLRIMRRHDPHVYPGTFVTCVYNPDRALCRRSDGNDHPSLSNCLPLQCRNVALTEDNRAALREHLTILDRQLANPTRLAPLVHHRLQHQRDQVDALLTADAEGTEGQDS